MPKTQSNADVKNKQFIFQTGEPLNTSATMSLLKGQDLQAFFKRLQKDLDKRKQSNERKVKAKMAEQQTKIQQECTFKPERARSRLALDIEKSMLSKYQSPILRSARERETKQQRLENDKSIIGVEQDPDQSYLFKMNDKSRQILAKKAKKEKKAGPSSARKSRNQSLIEEPPVKQAQPNKKTEIILVQKFNSDWDELLRAQNLVSQKLLSFDQFLQILIGFRMVKQFSEEQKKSETAQTLLISQLFNEVAGVTVNSDKVKANQKIQINALKLILMNILSIPTNIKVKDKSPLRSHRLRQQNISNLTPGFGAGGSDAVKDDQSTTADIEEVKKEPATDGEYGLGAMVQQVATAKKHKELKLKYQSLILAREENLHQEKQEQLKIKHKQETEYPLEIEPSFKPQISKKSQRTFEKLVNESYQTDVVMELPKSTSKNILKKDKTSENFTFNSKV